MFHYKLAPPKHILVKRMKNQKGAEICTLSSKSYLSHPLPQPFLKKTDAQRKFAFLNIYFYIIHGAGFKS